MSRKFFFVMIILCALLISGCNSPATHSSVSAALSHGEVGDWVRLSKAQIEQLSYDPIMGQTSMRLEADELRGSHIIAIAYNGVVKSGLEELQREEPNLIVSAVGRLGFHEDLGWLIFVHELNLLNF